jgi:hypothetical protein
MRRKSRCSILVVFLLCLCCHGQDSQSSKTRPSSPAAALKSEGQVGGVHPGTIAGTIYSNPFFGFSLEIPEGWQVADYQRAQALAEKTKQEYAERDPSMVGLMQGNEVDFRLLVMGEREPWKESRYPRSVYILSTNVSRRPGEPSADGFLKFVAMMSKEKGLPSEYGDTLEHVTLGGKKFGKVYFTQTSSTVWHCAHLATIEKRHVLQLMLLSPDEDGLRGLEAMMGSLHFESWAQEDRPDVVVAEIKAEGPGRSIISKPGEPAKIELDLAPKPTVPCPTEVRFKALIRLSHAPLTLTYWWERSNGKTQEVTVDVPVESKLVLDLVDAWTTGIRRESSWMLSDRLHVRSGDVDHVSETARISLNCSGPAR